MGNHPLIILNYMRCIKLVLLISILSLMSSCSSSEKEVQQQKTDDKYFFDEIPPEDFVTFETPVEKADEEYIVQIGAFSSFEKAKQFADFSRVKLQKDIKVNFNERNNLYVVQIHPPFRSRTEAELYRNELWKIEDYDDAWVVTVKINGK